MIKKLFLVILITSLYSCIDKPTYCENPQEVTTITLELTDTSWDNRVLHLKGRRIEIKNDSLISFLTQQLCSPKEVIYSTGTRGEGERIKVQLNPNPSNKEIYVVYLGTGRNGIRYRQGSTYFKNDLFCETIFALMGLQNYMDTKLNKKAKKEEK